MVLQVAVVVLPEAMAIMCYVAGSGRSVAGSGGDDVLTIAVVAKRGRQQSWRCR